MEDSQTEVVSESELNLRKTVRERLIIGGLMFTASSLVLVAVLIGLLSIPDVWAYWFFIPLTSVGLSGLILVVYYGNGSSKMYHSMNILRQLSPPELFIEGKYAVLDKNPVYGISQWGSNILFFAAFHQSERTFDQSVKVPGLIWTWDYKHKIGSVKVAIREDEKFTIPTGPGSFYTGKGILYCLLVEESALVRYQRRFDTTQLEGIVKHLTNAIASDGSDLSSSYSSSD